MVIVYGTVCLDRISPVERIPQPGEYAELGAERVRLGGEAANTAALLVRWGTETILVGNSIGSGTEADMIMGLLHEHGLSKARLPRRVHPAPTCYIFVEPNGQRTMFGRGFKDLEKRSGLNLLPDVSAEWLSTDANHGAASCQAVEWIHGKGGSAYAMDLLEGAPTRAGDICQTSPDWIDGADTIESLSEYALNWADRQSCLVFVTAGEQGLVAALPGGKIWKIPSIPSPVVFDSTGAGDAFRAGMLFGLDQKWEFNDCLITGLCSGALACTQYGALRAGSEDLKALELDQAEAVKRALSAAKGLAEAYNCLR
jgi:sugar/nucleoside kinase (ribokinase family)